MIQAIRETNFDAFIETKANRIANVGADRIRHLVKFTNDLDGSVFYAYPLLENIYQRYTNMAFVYNATPNRYTGKLNLKPAGYYKYGIYEVSWIGTPVITKATAPATEIDILPVDNDNGVVEGLVAIGQLYLGEKDGSEEVQYIQNAKRVQTLTIVNSGEYGTAPTVTIGGPGTTGGQTATATCTIDGGGAIDTVTITYAGSGYITNPIVKLTGGTPVTEGNITASIEQTNYIYYGQ